MRSRLLCFPDSYLFWSKRAFLWKLSIVVQSPGWWKQMSISLEADFNVLDVNPYVDWNIYVMDSSKNKLFCFDGNKFLFCFKQLSSRWKQSVVYWKKMSPSNTNFPGGIIFCFDYKSLHCKHSFRSNKFLIVLAANFYSIVNNFFF